jgi:hypothetical protein
MTANTLTSLTAIALLALTQPGAGTSSLASSLPPSSSNQPAAPPCRSIFEIQPGRSILFNQQQRKRIHCSTPVTCVYPHHSITKTLLVMWELNSLQGSDKSH